MARLSIRFWTREVIGWASDVYRRLHCSLGRYGTWRAVWDPLWRLRWLRVGDRASTWVVHSPGDFTAIIRSNMPFGL